MKTIEEQVRKAVMVNVPCKNCLGFIWDHVGRNCLFAPSKFHEVPRSTIDQSLTSELKMRWEKRAKDRNLLRVEFGTTTSPDYYGLKLVYLEANSECTSVITMHLDNFR